MDGDIIKKILKDDSEKLIIMDGGKPKFVVMSYLQYLKLAEKNNNDTNLEMNFSDLFPKLDLTKEMPVIKIDEKLAETENSRQSKELTLDDLPIT